MNTGPVKSEGAPTFQGVRMDHPRILEGIRVLLGKGYGNEQICKVIGVPNEIVDRERSRFNKLKP